MTKRLKIIVFSVCMLGIVAFRADAQQAAPAGNAPNSGEAQQIRQDMEALRQQAEPLKTQLKQIMDQAKPIKEQLRTIREKIKADREKLEQLHGEHKEHRQEWKQQHNGQQPPAQAPSQPATTGTGSQP